MHVVVAALGKAVVSMVMSLASEKVMREVLLMVAEMAAASTKTKWDDKLVAKVKEAIDEDA